MFYESIEQTIMHLATTYIIKSVSRFRSLTQRYSGAAQYQLRLTSTLAYRKSSFINDFFLNKKAKQFFYVSSSDCKKTINLRGRGECAELRARKYEG